jgi:hypothetical protein
MKLKPIKYSLFKEGDNPIFGESAFHFEMMDDAAGAYLKLSQCTYTNHGEILIDFREIPDIINALVKLKEEWEEENV